MKIRYMTKYFVILSLIVFLSNKLYAQFISSDQYTVQEGMVLYDVATFEEGVDNPWDPSSGQYAARFWTATGATYSYTPGTTSSVNTSTMDVDTDDMNYWDVFGNSNGVSGYTGYADLDYQLYIPTSEKIYSFEDWTSNYQNWNGYTNLQIKWYAWNSDETKNVILEVYVYTEANGGQWIEMAYMNRAPNTMYTDSFSLSGLTSTELAQISLIKFRVFNDYIEPGNASSCGRQRTHLYSIKLINNNVPTTTTTIDTAHTITTYYLGNILHKRYGSYSPTGFYDTSKDSSGIFRIWFGGGTTDGDSQDNVWYIESPSLDPEYLKSNDLQAKKCTVTPGDILLNENGKATVWGDPSVLRFVPSSDSLNDNYYMWVSALADGTTWNQIYRLVSSDGINWTINPTSPVVAAEDGGVAGYGTGSPSVIYMDSTYMMWYYSQSETAGAGAYLRMSTDGISWGTPTKTNVFSSIDVKYLDSLDLFVGVRSEEVEGAGVNTLISYDGITWVGDQNKYISQNYSAYVCHNPGFIGTDMGYGWPDMYAAYGASQEVFGPTEYYTRELEYSSWHISSQIVAQEEAKYTGFVDQGSASIVQADKITMYPNPAMNVLKVDGVVSTNIKISSINGRTLKVANNVSEVNISDLPNGTYLVTIKEGENILTEKLLITR
uniref:T9SS type A sorting domain-containing protein n=1 Tax=uncultured Draconibacterium sp. TaxID=1573823 RepID=UPI0032163CAA